MVLESNLCALPDGPPKMQAIINNCTALRETMEISSHGMDDCSRRANGMLSLMDKLSTYFILELSVFIFSVTEQLSVTLQAEQTNVDDCFMAVDLCIRSLERIEGISNSSHFMIL